MADAASVKARLLTTYRDFRVEGVPASGANEPVKSEVRSSLDALVDLAAQATVTKAVATKAQLSTIPTPKFGDSARVTADPLGNVSNGNGVYSWTGSAWSWVGPWVDPGIQAQIDYNLAAAQGVPSAAFSESVQITSAGNPVAHSNYRTTGFLKVEGSVEYKLSGGLTGTAYSAWYDADRVFISPFRGGVANNNPETSTHTSPPNARFARVSSSLLALTSAYFGPSAGRVSIDQVKHIVEQHPPVLPASTIMYDDATVEGVLTQQKLLIRALQGQVADIGNELDLAAEANLPLFVPTSIFTKSHTTVAPVETITVVSRDSASQFTVAAGKGAKLAEGGAVVIHDSGNNRYPSFGIKTIDGDVVTVHGALPATIASCQTMHMDNFDQHLGRFGYYGLAEFLAGQNRKYAFRKDKRLFTYQPTASTTPSYNNPDIYDRATGLTKLIDVTTIGGATGGGLVSGTTNLPRLCQTLDFDRSNGAVPLGQFTPRFYVVQDNGVGKGIEFSFPAGGVDGHVLIAIGAARVTYNSTLKTEGRVRLEVLADAVSIHDQTYEAGDVKLVSVDLARANTILIRMTLADAAPTSARLHYVYAYQKAPTTPATLFNNGDVVAFLGDSWTQFPNAIDGEVRPLRPDGTASDGMQFLSERLRTVLALQGKTITTLNYGKGGATSAWGAYWVSRIINASPRPTHCVVNFGINDLNGFNPSTSTAYDFDPVDMWSFKTVALGGVAGRVPDAATWEANIKTISDQLLRAGIKPIIMLPPNTGSVGQSYGLQRDLLSRLSAGFETPL